MTNPKLDVLTPQNSQLIFIDHQPQMAFGVQSIDRQVLKNNVVGLAKAARVFNIPTTLTTVETTSFSGHTYPELLDVFPGQPILERTSMNSWDDQKVRDALAANGRKKVVVAGLWTEVCNTTFALCAMLEGDYEIYMVSDASGGTSKEAHDMAMLRMVQAGVNGSATGRAARPTTPSSRSSPSIRAPMAWAWTMPTRWCTTRRRGRLARTRSWRPYRRNDHGHPTRRVAGPYPDQWLLSHGRP
jgi:nicotinamidase-related amidase